jgi:hypothetical protein
MDMGGLNWKISRYIDPLVQFSGTTTDNCAIGFVTINALPDDALLEIFEFYVHGANDEADWEALVHVCRRWRRLVFSASHRLKLRIVCTVGTPAMTMVDVWPALPISIWVAKVQDGGLHNVIAALENNDRVSEILVDRVSKSDLERIAASMRRPFPLLTDLHLVSFDEPPAGLPNMLLGGSAPHLQILWLEGISFPALPKLLLSAKNLVRLHIEDIPRSGYISSKAMVECLPSLTRLEQLQFAFVSARSIAVRETLHPRSRAHPVLPMLTSLSFAGGSEYLGNLYACIAGAQLRYANLLLFTPTVFRISQFTSFLGSTEPFEGLNQAHMHFNNIFIQITLSSRDETAYRSTLIFSIKYGDSVWQLFSVTKCSSPFFPDIESPNRFDSGLFDNRLKPRWVDDMANAKWVELLRYFPAVEDLYLSEGLSLCLAPTMREFAERGVTDALPALKNLFLEDLEPSGPVWQPLLRFAAMKHLSGHPVRVQGWIRN